MGETDHCMAPVRDLNLLRQFAVCPEIRIIAFVVQSQFPCLCQRYLAGLDDFAQCL